MTKYARRFLSIMILLLCVLLFLQRLTGEIWHAILGILLILAAAIHILSANMYCRQNMERKHSTYSIRITDWVLPSLLTVLCLTGMLLHPLHGVPVLKILHKLSAILFVPGLIAHIVQHKRVPK